MNKPNKNIHANLITGKDLSSMEFEPLNWAVDGILPSGLTILGGRPKAGKSWFALELCYSVAADEPFLGRFEVAKGPAIYIALEDSKRRLKVRLNTVREGGAVPNELYFLDSFYPLKSGAEEALENLLSVYNPGIIVIDTLAKISPATGGSKNSYLADYQLLGNLQKIVVNSDTAVVLIHHTRKMEAEYVFDEISGTTGLTGAADTIMVLKQIGRDRGEFHITGRDIESQNFELDFKNGIWSYFGESISAAEEEKQLYETVISLLDQGFSQSEVAAQVGTSQPTISRLLKKWPRRNHKLKIAS